MLALLLAVISPHTIGIFWIAAAIVATIMFVLCLLPISRGPAEAGWGWGGFVPAGLFVVLALYLWPAALQQLG